MGPLKRLWDLALKWLFEGSLLIAILGGCVILFNGVVEPYHRGFYCSDVSIFKPYKPSTISTKMLLAACLGFPCIIIAVVEIIGSFRESWNFERSEFRYVRQHLYHGCTDAYLVCIEFLFGWIIVVALMHIGKSTFGILRPHFIDVCKPNFTTIDCSKGYITDYACQGLDLDVIRHARESFPSGHSAAAIYAMLFLYIYLNEKTWLNSTQGLRLGKLTFQTLFLIFAVICCISRVTDHWHHWTDVLGGIALGSGIVTFLWRKGIVQTAQRFEAVLKR